MDEIQKAVVVTGVSTGIGLATAKCVIDAGLHVFGSVRSQKDADAVTRMLGSGFTPLIFDVTDQDAVREASYLVRDKLNGRVLNGLINNAGIALGGPLLHLPIDEFRKQLEVNLTGVLIVTQIFTPLLKSGDTQKERPGRIINMGSIGGRHAFPFMVPYHTSKYGLEGFTEGLRRELMPYGVDAILVAPGSVQTPIWEKADKTDKSKFAETDYADALQTFNKIILDTGEKGLPANRIGDIVVKALTVAKPKTYYRLTSDPILFHLLTKLPKRWVDWMIARQIGFLPKPKN